MIKNILVKIGLMYKEPKFNIIDERKGLAKVSFVYKWWFTKN